MKNKKLLAGLVAIMSIVGMAGCGPTSNPTEPTNPSVEPSVEPSTEPSTEPSISNPTSTVDPNEKTNKDFEKAKTTYIKT